jgi:hypothetical protein
VVNQLCRTRAGGIDALLAETAKLSRRVTGGRRRNALGFPHAWMASASGTSQTGADPPAAARRIGGAARVLRHASHCTESIDA